MENIRNMNSTHLVKFSLGILFIIPALPSNAKAIAIVFFVLTTLSFLFYRKWHFNKNLFFTNALIYLIILGTLLYSDNMEYATRKITTMVSLLVFPFVFSMFTKEEIRVVFKNVKSYLLLFVLAVFLFNIVGLGYAYYLRPHYSVTEMLIHYPTLVALHFGKFSIHPIYISMNCAIAVLLSFYAMKEYRSKLMIALLLLIDLVLVLFLMWYAKKGPLIALMIAGSLFVVFQRKEQLLKPYLIGLVLIGALIVIGPKTRKNFSELFKIEHIDGGNVTSTNLRYTINQISTQLILNAPFTGYGVGDYNDVLHHAYEQNGNDILVAGKYNAHNQYFSLVLIGGVLCLLALLLSMAINMVYAIRFDNQILMLLLIFYGIVMCTENILEREDGVIYFAFFLNFFGMLSYENKEELDALQNPET